MPTLGQLLCTSVIVSLWMDFGLPPRCPQVVRCYWGESEPFSATLAQNGLAECDQPGKNPLKCCVMARNWTRATRRYIRLSLSYHDPAHGEDRLWDTFVLPLSYLYLGHGKGRQWDTFVLPLSYYYWGDQLTIKLNAFVGLFVGKTKGGLSSFRSYTSHNELDISTQMEKLAGDLEKLKHQVSSGATIAAGGPVIHSPRYASCGTAAHWF